MSKRRVMLTDSAFGKLVRGEVVSLTSGNGDEIEVALQDIGWHRMEALIEDAVRAGRAARSGNSILD